MNSEFKLQESESEHEDAASADISGSEAAGPASSENSVQIIENRRDTDEPLVPVQGEGCRCAFCRPIFQADGQDSVSGSDSDEDEMQSAGSTGCRKRETKRPVSVEDAIDPDLMTTTPVVGLFDRDHGRPASALPDPFVADCKFALKCSVNCQCTNALPCSSSSLTVKPEDLRPGPSGTSTPKPAVKRKYKALDCVTTTGPTESGLGTLANSAVTSSPVGRVTRSTQAWRSKRQRFKAIFCSSDTSDEEYGPTPPKEVEPGVGFGVESNLAKNAGTSLSEVGVQACPDNGDDGPRGIRFETSSSSGEDTDFENEEDIRALFNDGSDDWRERAENDPVLGNPRDPPRKVARSNHYVGKEKVRDCLCHCCHLLFSYTKLLSLEFPLELSLELLRNFSPSLFSSTTSWMRPNRAFCTQTMATRRSQRTSVTSSTFRLGESWCRIHMMFSKSC